MGVGLEFAVERVKRDATARRNGTKCTDHAAFMVNACLIQAKPHILQVI
jgi:hypothetical protein